MPELPEVETVARQLSPLATGRVVRRLEVGDPLLGALRYRRAARRQVARVFRHGKQVAFELRTPAAAPLWLIVHLRMTGRLLWCDLPRGGCVLPVRARLLLDQGAVLFHDMRRFGTLALHDDLAASVSWAVDPITGPFSAEILRRLIGDCRQEIKAWLLRQDRLVGIGNIYASEILFEARIDPRRRAGSLTPAELRRLHAATARILAAAIRHCGTTFSSFQNARGLSGGYQRYLAVYGKQDDPCPRCGRPIARLVQQQRSTFFCPRCQKNSRFPV